jgi:hypothetical protein
VNESPVQTLRINGESRCPECRKLLSKPMLKIRFVSMTVDQFHHLMDQVQISFGAQGPCKRCKVLRETEQLASFK